MKKLLMILITCLCLTGCSSNSSASKTSEYKIEGTEFSITNALYRVASDYSVSINFNLKNNSQEHGYDHVKLYFELLNEKEEKVSETSLDYEQLEKGKEIEAMSWAFPAVILSQETVDGDTNTSARSLMEEDFVTIKLKAILITGKDYTELETPVMISKTDMTKEEAGN